MCRSPKRVRLWLHQRQSAPGNTPCFVGMPIQPDSATGAPGLPCPSCARAGCGPISNGRLPSQKRAIGGPFRTSPPCSSPDWAMAAAAAACLQCHQARRRLLRARRHEAVDQQQPYLRARQPRPGLDGLAHQHLRHECLGIGLVGLGISPHQSFDRECPAAKARPRGAGPGIDRAGGLSSPLPWHPPAPSRSGAGLPVRSNGTRRRALTAGRSGVPSALSMPTPIRSSSETTATSTRAGS